MEKLLGESKDNLLDERFHQKLTEEFNRSATHSRSQAIQKIQVERWFKKRSDTESIDSHNSAKALVSVTDTRLSDNLTPESSSEVPDTENKTYELEQIEFEAKSSTDHAWYDVAEFLEHRILSNGDPEVKVRFRDFDCEDDEWINVKKNVRERSIPLESTECLDVEVGNLVLCFRERGDQAQYYDAHVQEIQRKVHDIRGCRCIFKIRYDHDLTEERVPLRRLCRRPKRRYMGSKFLVD